MLDGLEGQGTNIDPAYPSDTIFGPPSSPNALQDELIQS